MKSDKEIIGITLSPEVIKLLNESNFNKSKLIDSLLTKYFKNKKKS